MFREVLIESAPGHTRGTAVGFPMSVAIHGLVVATAILISAKGAEEPLEPPMPVVFQVSSPPPPGPSGSTAVVPAARRSDGRAVTVLHRAPIPIEASVPFPAAPSNPAEVPGVTSNDEGDDDGPAADPGGVPDGTGRSPFIVRGGESDAAIPVGGDVQAPRLVERVEPIYPDAARTIRAQGLVILEAVITAAGRVEEVRVLRSPNPLLAASAIAAVQQWRYLPATLNRRPVKVFLTVTVDFKLH